MVQALLLARAGWWGGDPEKVLAASPESVVAAMAYEDFMHDYQRTYIELNRTTK